jgi:hypothetical protein
MSHAFLNRSINHLFCYDINHVWLWHNINLYWPIFYIYTLYCCAAIKFTTAVTFSYDIKTNCYDINPHQWLTFMTWKSIAMIFLLINYDINTVLTWHKHWSTMTSALINYYINSNQLRHKTLITYDINTKLIWNKYWSDLKQTLIN